MAEFNSRKILEEFVAHHEGKCPMCRHVMAEEDACPRCHERLCLGLSLHDTSTDIGLNRRWCILFVPWFLMCYSATTSWSALVSGALFRGEDISNIFGLHSMEFMSILAFASGWLELFSPIMCVLLWCFRTRINKLPVWSIWTGFGLGVLLWIQKMYWPVSLMLI